MLPALLLLLPLLLLLLLPTLLLLLLLLLFPADKGLGTTLTWSYSENVDKVRIEKDVSEIMRQYEGFQYLDNDINIDNIT